MTWNPHQPYRDCEMKAGTGEISAAAAIHQERLLSRATIVLNVMIDWARPKTWETICTGRLEDSLCACWSWS